MLRCQSEKVEFWRWVLVEFERSGLSVREFCHQEGISEPSSYSWRKKISQLDAGGRRDLPVLMPVRVVPDPMENHPVGHGASTSVPDKTLTGSESTPDSHSALATERVVSASLTGLRHWPQIEVATPSGLVIRIGQACSRDLIERTLMAIQSVAHDQPRQAASC